MGQFNVGDETNPTTTLREKTDWRVVAGTVPQLIALVEDAQLKTPDGITLTFKQGSILSMITGSGVFIYRDVDLK